MAPPERWDIFCRVVDNYGDAGVCWRLARALVHEHRFSVRLRIDDLASLARLEPAVVDGPRQTVDGVEVVRWDPDEAEAIDGAPPDVVVEGFGCGLPERYVERIVGASRPPLWIVLEYLSAEPWVPEHHGLPSPHPRSSIERYFFFPGFVHGTGGVLREEDLFRRRDAFGETQRDAYWRSVGHAPTPPEATVVSLFAYESAPVGALLRHWEEAAGTTIAAVPEGRLLPAVLKHFGLESIPANRLVRRGALEVRVVPFVAQARFDELLWACDVNFVRGEDSFVRAQWAARPFVWHAYPQEEAAHSHKLQAFLRLYCDGLAPAAAAAVRDLMMAWNQLDAGAVTPGAAWDALAAQRDELRRHAGAWAGRIAAVGDLADNLASFCRDKLK